MRVYFNRRIIRAPWGGGAHFMSAMVDFLKDAGHEIVDDLVPNIDLIFLMDPRHEAGGTTLTEVLAYRHMYPKTKILHRVNECDARKGTSDVDGPLLLAMEVADRVVFISDWLRWYFEKLGFSRPADVVYNGCNTDWFYPAERGPLSLTDPVKIVTHHWSDNYMKGFDIYNDIDRLAANDWSIDFTYIGRYNKGYNPQSTRVIAPLYGPELGDELRRHDIYVTASRCEPCGMHHIEAAACGLPVLYHRDGGAIPDMCRHHGLEFHDIPTLLEGLHRIRESLGMYRSMINHNFLDIKRCCEQYHQIMRAMLV